jgi:tetratricopeptide (TPR) repeat protein
MSRTLNLVDRLMAMGRKFQELGRDQDARHVFGQVTRFAELPAPIAEETQARLAEIHLKHHRYRRARRHLGAALAHQPENARYHYLLANALDTDTRGDSDRAAEHYRRSLELEPRQPRCLGEYGLLCLRLGQADEGLEALRRAVELAPDDPEAIGNLVEGLRQEGHVDEARTALRAARFRNPRDVRFRKLWSDFEFHQLRQQQEAERHSGRNGWGQNEGPMLLPFVRPAPEGLAVRTGQKVVRRDGATPPASPHLARRLRRPDQKRAQ